MKSHQGSEAFQVPRALSHPVLFSFCCLPQLEPSGNEGPMNVERGEERKEGSQME